MKVRSASATMALFALVCGEAQLFAQAASAPATYLEDSASPFSPPPPTAGAPVKMPDLAYAPTAADAADFDKYYAFQRADTDVETAFADLVECDGYARGFTYDGAMPAVPYPYAGTMAGAMGGALGGAFAAAVFGSAEKRRLRRVNMRTCMNYKGYSRHGLPKSVWDRFNFEEGLSGMDEKRYAYLRQQAMVAASGKLQGEALGL